MKDQLPIDNISVETKVKNDKGDHKKVVLKKHKHLWFNPETLIYVYYQPTHWRTITV